MSRRTRAVLDAVVSFLVFFVLLAFIVTCCFFLFMNTMTEEMDLQLTNEHLQLAAKLTFANVILLSLLFSTADSIRRHFTVQRPVQKILEATNAMASGDFTVRIPEFSKLDIMYGFDDIGRNLNHMAQELSGTETLRTDFIANVSHELKTPLAVIQNYGTMLQQPGLTEPERLEYAKTITQTSRRLASLITNILKLNKLENQQIFPVVEKYDLGEQLCECLLAFEEVWEKKEMEIETEIEEGVLVNTDPELMSLVWNNLFSNAIKFTDKGGKLGLSLSVEQGRAVVKVSDTGCGISPEVGKRMFDKFYQGDTSHAVQGNGLGLALVKRVIDITGSEISVESEIGKGTTFTVRLRGVR